MSIKKQLIIAFVLLLSGGAVALLMAHHSSPPARSTHKRPIFVVDTMVVHPTHYHVKIHTYAEVRARDRASVTSQQQGRVVFISSHLYPGCFVKKGEVLIRLDKRDYEIEQAQAMAELERAKADLEKLREDASQAREEWNMLHPHRPIPPLVAKLPQLRSAQARVEAARASLRLARLHLKRTTILSPFEGVVISRNVELGQFVAPGENLALIYSSSAVEVYIPLSLEQVQWLRIPGYNEDKQGQGSVVSIEFGRGRGKGRYMSRIERCSGEIDKHTRMLYAIAPVYRPLRHLPPLLPNTFVTVSIMGEEIFPAFVIPDSALHGKNRVFKVIKGHVYSCEVKIAYRARDTVVVREGLSDGDRVVISPLAGDVEGVEVRVER